ANYFSVKRGGGGVIPDIFLKKNLLLNTLYYKKIMLSSSGGLKNESLEKGPPGAVIYSAAHLFFRYSTSINQSIKFSFHFIIWRRFRGRPQWPQQNTSAPPKR